MPQSDKKFSTMRLEYKDKVAVLTLSRPEAMNAMNGQFFADFQDVIAEISAVDCSARALLILAEGKGFCAGADLKDGSGAMTANLGKALRENYNPLITGLKKLPLPTVVAINGAVAGAGMSLVLACDIAIAESNAYFLQAFINIALVPDAGSTYFLPRLVGRARATEMMMLGEKLPADKALEYGIISKLVDLNQLPAEAMAIAEKLASLPTQALLSIRELLDSSEGNDLNQQLEFEADAQQKASQSPDFREGVSAFLQKRPAKFTER